MVNKKKIVRTSTVPISLNILLKGQLNFLNNYYEVIGVSGEGNLLREVEDREGIRVYPIDIKRNISVLHDLISLIKLYVYFKKEKPQIVHSITPKAGLLSMIAAYFARVPIRIHTFTGLIFPTSKGLKKHLLIFMDRLLCKSATHIYPEGEGIKQDLITYSITKKTLKVLANGNINGIDNSYFNPLLFPEEKKQHLKKELNIQKDDFVFIFVGRIVGDKGVNELIHVFDKLSKEQNGIKLLLVGPFEDDLDPLEGQTKEIIKTNKAILSVGYQNDVRPYFAISNALVFPSYREGFPNVVLQAGAMGLPSIVSDINGCNEIIKEGVNGFIIPVKNQEALEEAMKKILLDNKIKENARKMIQDRFEQHVVWEALLAEYKSLEYNV